MPASCVLSEELLDRLRHYWLYLIIGSLHGADISGSGKQQIPLHLVEAGSVDCEAPAEDSLTKQRYLCVLSYFETGKLYEFLPTHLFELKKSRLSLRLEACVYRMLS